jgi:LysM repeat protein
MDINQLRAALAAFENQPGQSFAMPAANITAWTAIHDLVENACASQTLTIWAIRSFPPPHVVDSIVYIGQAALFPWNPQDLDPPPVQALLAVTATFTVDGHGNPQLLVQAIAPTGATAWHLSDSIGNLWETIFDSVAFDDGSLFLTSVATTQSSFPGTLLPWIDFVGTISLSDAFALVQSLVDTDSSRTVSGQIALISGGQPTLKLTPVTTTQVSLGGVKYDFGAELNAWYKTLQGPASNPWPIATAEIVAHLRLGTAQEPIELRMPMLPGGTSLTLSIENGDHVLAGWSELNGLSQGVDLGALIPSGVPAIGKLTLRGLGISLQLGSEAPVLESISFDVALGTNEWAALPNNILVLDEIGAQLTVTFGEADGASASGNLYGRFSFVDKVQLFASISIPQLSLTASLDDGTAVSMADVMDAFMQKLTGRSYRPPIDMMIAELALAVEIRTGAFAFQGTVLTDWSVSLGTYNGGSLITLAFDGISFDIAYNGATFSGTISAYTSINDVQFYLSAGTSGGPDAGWNLAAGTAPGSVIRVADLLTNFMFPGGNVPGGNYNIPTLDVTQLDLTLSLDTNNTPFAFQVSGTAVSTWNFQVFSASGPTLQLTVTLAVEGTRALSAYRRVSADADWSISGNIGGQLTLFGLQVAAGYSFDPENSSLTFGIWYGNRGLEAAVTQRPHDEKNPSSPKDTILTVHLGALSLGEILEFLIDLAVPGETRTLPAPWDFLYQIDFKNLSLVANLTTNAVEVRYETNFDLVFARLTAVGLLYKNVNGQGSVYVQLYGDFLGQPYGTEDNPLSWDVVNEDAPAVPGKGEALIDIRYVGMGQHVTLSTPPGELRTVEDVIGALKEAMKPVSGGGNPLNDPAAASLRYDGNSKWLFGVEASLLEGTISLSAVFYDPYLYGALIELSGTRAGALAGLRIELVYRRITDDIGEFSIDLRVPEAFRNWEFGEVSITLGLIHLDIYTNGNFRVDAGFPHQLDFSGSFAVQVFPFIGLGGFYFAYLTGATSERVPAATNGTFDPVIEAGVGLAIGVGKEFSKGPLSAGLSLEVVGVFEGVYAPFHPYDAAVPKESYYWFQATVGIVGKLYGTIDFVVIKISVSVMARAEATIVFEAHEATLIDLRLDVEAEASIKIVFFTVHFSFSLTIEESITIGSHTTPPWLVGPSSDRKAPNRLLARFAPAATSPVQPRLRQQRPQRRARLLSRLRYAIHQFGAFHVDPALRAGRRRASLLANLNGQIEETVTAWTPIAVFGSGTPKTARLQFVPGFTIADPTTLDPPATGTVNEMQVVLMLLAENTVDPAARTAADVARRATHHLHAFDEDETPGFPLIVEAFFRWAAAAGAQATGSDPISLLQLQDLLTDLADPEFQQATFAYANLTSFLNLSLHLQVAGYPTGAGTPTTSTSGTFVPIVPEMTATVTVAGQTRTQNFLLEPTVSTAYVQNLAAYFQQLATNAAANTAADPFNRQSANSAREYRQADPPSTDPSLAQVIFGDYFALVTRTAIQAAIDLLSAYPYKYPATNAPTLDALAASFDSLSVPMRLAKGQTLADVAAVTGIHPDQLKTINGPPGDGPIQVKVGVSALSIAQDNASAPLAAGTQFNMSGLPYQIRSGQSLNDIAAAAPRQITVAPQPHIEPAPTGITLGENNASIPGLLQRGTTVTVPSFIYTRLANDTDAFLASFFKVRNQGVAGAANLDWFTQAIATLNPSIDWSNLQNIALLYVPQAYLNTSPAPVQYPIHQGDTLVRIAAVFSDFYQAGGQYAANPAGGSYTVPQTSHAVAATDTFASLVIDFPGLSLQALVGANVTADILTPLATLLFPSYGAAFGPGDSLATLAAAFDLVLSDLVDAIQSTATPVFVADTPLTIRDVPRRSVDDIVSDLNTAANVNYLATQTSRFLMYGMRIPSPSDPTFLNLTPAEVLAGDFTGSLYGLYDVNGQQFTWPAPAANTMAITLAKSAAPWLTFVETTTFDGTTPTDLLRTLNPRLASGSAPAGVVIAAADVDTLQLTVDVTTFSRFLPSTTLTLDASPPQAMELFDVRTVHYNIQANIHWQAASPPQLPAANIDSENGQPSIWPFTQQLLQKARAGTPSIAYGLFSVPLDAPPGTEGVALDSYAWATLVPVTIQRVASAGLPDSAGQPAQAATIRWLEQTYLVIGADQTGADLLYALWVYLQTNASTEAGTKLYLLYPPNATGSNPTGLASAALAGGVFLLKTNLSTETRQPNRDASDSSIVISNARTAPSYSAGLDDSAAFVTFLWEATVVQPGGFYLHYQSGGSGLPDSIFDQSGRAVLNLLCLLATQTNGSSGGSILPVNNCVVVADNVDAGAVQIYARQTSPGAPTTKVANVPPGNVGFTILRTPPEIAFPSDSAEQLTAGLYNLFGFGMLATDPFGASNQGLPVGSAPATAPNAGKWFYHQVLNAALRATDQNRVPQHCPALPDPMLDPYAGVTPTSEVDVQFAAHDAFGNKALASDPPPNLGIPFRYIDRVIGLGEWPGAIISYTIQPAPAGATAPVLVINLSLQSTNYCPGPGLGTPAALYAASTHALRYQQIFYQINRPGITITATTTADNASTTTPLVLVQSRFTGFCAAAYVFTSQLAGLTPEQWTVGIQETLSGLANSFSITAKDLLEANQDLPASQIFPGPLNVPQFDRVKRNETLAQFAARAGITAATLLATGNNLQTPVPAGARVVVSDRTFQVEEGQTLSAMAEAAGCSPGDIAQANDTTAELLADSLTLEVRGIPVVTLTSTFQSLVADYAAHGITTTAEEIATANSSVPGIFNAVSVTGPVHYIVRAWISQSVSTIQTLVSAQFSGSVDNFIALNQETPGILKENSRLQTGSTTSIPPVDETLRRYVQDLLVLSLDEFAKANATALMRQGTTLLLPALLDATPLSAVPYATAGQQSLNDIAALFTPATATTIGESNQDIGGIFVAGQQVTVGSMGPVMTDAEDSLATLLLKFPVSARPTLDQLIQAIAPSTTLLRPGAVFICPAPAVPPSTLSFGRLSTAYGCDLQSLARINASIDGLLDSTASITVGGVTISVGPHGTLAGVYARVLQQGVTIDFPSLITMLASNNILKAGAKFLLPPPAATAGAEVPVVPAVTCTITPLAADVTIARPSTGTGNEINPSFADVPEVASATTPVPPLAAGNPASYKTFADSLEAAYAGQFRVAAGKTDDVSQRALYIARFAAAGTTGFNAIRKVTITNAPTYFALPPLCNELVSRTAEIRIYKSGDTDPLPPPTERRTFQAVDVQSWAGSALEAIDLLLSPSYAVNAFTVTASGAESATFNDLVEAKRILAEKISSQLESVLEPSSGVLATAQEALKQTLDINLMGGFSTDAVLQLPTTVDASFDQITPPPAACADEGGHRLAGKPQAATVLLSETTTLQALSLTYIVNVAAVARLLGLTPNLLATGTTLEFSGKSWTIGPHDTLKDGVETLKLGTLDAFAIQFGTQAPLFRDAAALTIDGYSADTRDGSTLASMADALDSGLAELAVANQSVSGLLEGTVFVDGVPHDVTPATSSLVGMAESLGIQLEHLAFVIAEQAVLAPSVTLHLVRWVPNYTLSAGKIDLDAAAGQLNLLLSVKQRAQHRRLLVNLDFQLTGLEHGIEHAPFTTGYEKSDWLQFIHPIEDPPIAATIDTNVGQVDIPVPLRAYPMPPRLIGQSAQPTFDHISPTEPLATQIQKAKAWTYLAIFETGEAAQDLVYLKIGINFATATSLSFSNEDDPFDALAEFNANYPAIAADLANLLLPPDVLAGNQAKLKAARSAVQAMTTIAQGIANHWGPIAPADASAVADKDVIPQQSFTFRMETRSRSGARDIELMDALVLIRDSGTNSWGPNDKIPKLGYIDHQGQLTPLKTPEVPPGPTPSELLYEFEQDVPAFVRRSYAIWYENLDAAVLQNARLSAWLTRNNVLVPGTTTNPKFVYRTPETHFYDIATPALFWQQTIKIGAGPVAGLQDAVRTLFTDLLGSSPGSATTQEKLALRYGFQLAAPAGNDTGPVSDDEIVPLIPVFFRPLFTYAATTPSEVQNAVDTWLAENPLAPNQTALFSLDLTMFSTLTSDRIQPLLELKRLDYTIM